MLKKGCILLCCYNGEGFLEEQIESFDLKHNPEIILNIHDDCSTDSTCDIIRRLQKDSDCGSRIKLSVNKSQKGFSKNFLFAVSDVEDNFSFYAFSDQDDVWQRDKLTVALEWLNSVPEDIPALYCSRTELVDRDENHIGYSPLFPKLPSFKNALVQSIAGGNTMIFNKAGCLLLKEAIKLLGENEVVSHDWFLYQIITGCGGKVFYDPNPHIMYRQHGSNVIGSNRGLKASFARIKKLLFKDEFANWNNKNIIALKTLEHLLTEENKEILSSFANLRKSPFIIRLPSFIKLGLYRQTFFDNLALILVVILKKI